MGARRFPGDAGGLFCARTSEGIVLPFPFMRGHIVNGAAALVAAPANFYRAATDIVRERFAGAPAPAAAAPWHNMPQRASAPPAIVTAPPPAPLPPHVRRELWGEVPQNMPGYDFAAAEEEQRRADIRRRAAQGWR